MWLGIRGGCVREREKERVEREWRENSGRGSYKGKAMMRLWREGCDD